MVNKGGMRHQNLKRNRGEVRGTKRSSLMGWDENNDKIEQWDNGREDVGSPCAKGMWQRKGAL